MAYQHIEIPGDGEKIIVNKDRSLNVSDIPTIPFIEGDDTDADATAVDAADLIVRVQNGDV